MTAPSAEALVDSLSREGLTLLHLVGCSDVEKKGRRTDGKEYTQKVEMCIILK